MLNLLLYLMAALYTLAGVNHFRVPRVYTAMIPPFLPYPGLLNTLSGLAEIVLGIGLLFPQTRVWAALGLIALLIAIFPANIYMALGEKFMRISPLIRWGRLPIQGLLVWWAYQYTK